MVATILLTLVIWDFPNNAHNKPLHFYLCWCISENKGYVACNCTFVYFHHAWYTLLSFEHIWCNNVKVPFLNLECLKPSNRRRSIDLNGLSNLEILWLELKLKEEKSLVRMVEFDAIDLKSWKLSESWKSLCIPIEIEPSVSFIFLLWENREVLWRIKKRMKITLFIFFSINSKLTNISSFFMLQLNIRFPTFAHEKKNPSFRLWWTWKRVRDCVSTFGSIRNSSR